MSEDIDSSRKAPNDEEGLITWWKNLETSQKEKYCCAVLAAVALILVLVVVCTIASDPVTGTWQYGGIVGVTLHIWPGGTGDCVTTIGGNSRTDPFTWQSLGGNDYMFGTATVRVSADHQYLSYKGLKFRKV